MWLLIQPHDVLLIRDGKPFTRSESHRATSLFPPTAFTVQGALRALVISEMGDWQTYRAGKDDRLNQLIGVAKSHSLGQLSFAGPYVARKIRGKYRRFFPLPADVAVENESYKPRFRVLSPDTAVKVTESNSNASRALSALDFNSEEEEPAGRYWLSEDTLVNDYGAGRSLLRDEETFIPQDDLFVVENRFGIGMDYARNNVDRDQGLLYSIGFIRMQPDAGLLLELPDDSPLATLFPNPQTTHVVRLGGEGRCASIRRLEPNEVVIPTRSDLSNALRYKLVCLTPTYLSNGYQPKADTTFNRQFITAALPRPLAIGGWDLAKGEPRPILKYLAAGSVFFFERQSADDPIFTTLLEQPDNSLPLSSLGFGEIFLTSWEG